MSTILKALRRLEEDRSAQSQRPLREEVTRGAASTKSRRGGWPLLAALLGLGVAAGAGGLAFWLLDRAPDSPRPAELAAAGSAGPRAKPAAAGKQPRRRGAAQRATSRSSPSPAKSPGAASEPELPAAALESKVEVVKRPPAEPRIAAGDPAGRLASERGAREAARPTDPAEIPGRQKRAVAPSPRAPAPSIGAREEVSEPPGAEEPVGSSVVTAGPEQAAPEPTAALAATPDRDAERRAAAPKPRPAYPEAPAGESSKQPAKPSAAPPREPGPGAAASSEIARAEIPALRVERTVWHPIAERRVALIEFEQSSERREIREGDAVGPLVVSQIEPSGVVFVHEGVEVRRRIGE